MKYYIIAGEASGDMHAANLMKQLKLRDSEAYFRVWGGDQMEIETDELAKHIRETSFMGIFIVVRNLRTIKRNFRFCENDIKNYKPDVLILIDNSGFNLRIAKYVKNKELGIKTYYYILPQAWAWRKKRVHTIQQWTNKRFAILPFEKEFYQSYGYEVDYVGHPILDAIANRKPDLAESKTFRKEFEIDDRPIIALLPGSRKHEINSKLQIMMQTVKHFPNYQFIIAGSETVDKSVYDSIVGKECKIVFGRTYDILNNAAAALVTSGTATLETALFNVPQVVCYMPGFATFYLLKLISNITYICIVNLILDKLVVTELIQNNFNEERLTAELKRILKPDIRTKIQEDYKLLETKLGGGGASERTAELMIADLGTN
jgi:lipid-A-disaccharide synthase